MIWEQFLFYPHPFRGQIISDSLVFWCWHLGRFQILLAPLNVIPSRPCARGCPHEGGEGSGLMIKTGMPYDQGYFNFVP